MGLSSSLNASVMGLDVNASALAAISDNIANSGTNGYKRSVTDFASIVTGSVAGTYDAGGVRVSSFKAVDERGSLISTSGSTDIAILGRGLLPVTTVAQRNDPNETRPLQFLSTGSFDQDEEGYLITSTNLQLLGWPVDSAGNVGNVTRTSAAGLQPINISNFNFATNPTTNVEAGINLPASSSVGVAGNAFTNSIEYFDDIGASQTLTLNFTSTANANQWTMTITDSATATANNPITTATLTFHDNGANAGYLDALTGLGSTTTPAAAWDATTGVLTLQVNDNVDPITFNIGPEDSTAGFMTQFVAEFAPVDVVKDGTPVGGLSYVEVDESGNLQAVYDTGFRQTIYKIPVADVPDLNGLQALDNQAFAISAESGDFYLWDAGTGPTGQMSGYVLEMSTTDIAAELTHLIETQRAYSSNARIITAVDEMMQETTNL
ncbi:MAG: flagellar hook-basal body complex protein [Pseudomonadota bacterium]